MAKNLFSLAYGLFQAPDLTLTSYFEADGVTRSAILSLLFYSLVNVCVNNILYYNNKPWIDTAP